MTNSIKLGKNLRESFSTEETNTKSLLMPSAITKGEENNPTVLTFTFYFYLIFDLQFIFLVLNCCA